MSDLTSNLEKLFGYLERFNSTRCVAPYQWQKSLVQKW